MMDGSLGILDYELKDRAVDLCLSWCGVPGHCAVFRTAATWVTGLGWWMWQGLDGAVRSMQCVLRIREAEMGDLLTYIV